MKARAYGFVAILVIGLVYGLCGQAGAGITDPNDLPGLKVWLDGQDVDGDGNPDTAAGLQGSGHIDASNYLIKWENKATGGIGSFDTKAAHTTNRPVYNSGVSNPLYDFVYGSKSTSGAFNSTKLFDSAGAEATIFVLFAGKYDMDDPCDLVSTGSGSTGWSVGLDGNGEDASQGGEYRIEGDIALDGEDMGQYGCDTRVHIFQYDRDGSALRVVTDGDFVNAISGTMTTYTTSTATEMAVLGDAAATGTRGPKGWCYEIIIYEGELCDAQANAVGYWLHQKYVDLEHRNTLETDYEDMPWDKPSSAIPEPATMGLLAIGGLGALLRRRRRA